MYKKGTANYNLPQWDALEHPDFLDDMNPAYNVIDEKLHNAETGSNSALEQLTTLTPIVEGLNGDMDDVQHDVTDLQTRCTNLEHTQLDHENRIKNLEQHDTDIDTTLAGFDESNTVIAEFNKTNAYINDVKKTIDIIRTKNTCLFDGMEYPTNDYVGTNNVKRKCGTLTLVEAITSPIELATIPNNSTIFYLNLIGVKTEDGEVTTRDFTSYIYVSANKLMFDSTQIGNATQLTLNFTVEYY